MKGAQLSAAAKTRCTMTNQDVCRFPRTLKPTGFDALRLYVSDHAERHHVNSSSMNKSKYIRNFLECCLALRCYLKRENPYINVYTKSFLGFWVMATY